ncbi:carbohydrate binding family 9 domain-containing protein [candidate division KSB1 bacterium]|nr:carbohydrate binding family 9 domain-containing protein [candidate division KSB1 bacterium]
MCVSTCTAGTLNITPQTGLQIDGVLESAWLRCGVADRFIQRNPTEDAPPSFPTRVYAAYDKDALYFGYLCLDARPDSISGRITRRDNSARSDFVDLYIDTFHDRRNCYFFTLTAAGVQSEGTVSNDNYFDAAWDCIWQSAVGRTDSGWVAEIRIPFQSIRHGGPRADGWGLNFARVIERKHEGSFWQRVERSRDFRVSEMGTLSGLANIAPSNHVEFLPHVVGRWDAAAIPPGTESSGNWHSQNEWENLGLYAKLVPAAAWTVDLAYQPDFAQVDIDNEVINLSDYPVYLQEKRPFFLEAKELFDTAPIQLLYTRRIADPDYGGRLNGHAGRCKLSILAGQNRSAGGVLQDAAAARALWDVGKLSNIGLTATHLSEPGFHANAVEAETRYKWTADNSVNVSGAYVDRRGDNTEPFMLQYRQSLGHRYVNSYVSSFYRGPDFAINDLGWSSYSNVFQQTLWIGREYYPKHFFLESIGFDLSTFHNALTNGKFDQGEANLGFYQKTRGQNWLGFGASVGKYTRRKYDDAGSSHDNFGNFDINVHPGNGQWLWFDSDNRRPVELHVYTGHNTFREGKAYDINANIVAKPRGNLEATLASNFSRFIDVIDIRDGALTDYHIWRLNARWSPTLDMSFRATVQFLNDSDLLLTNLLYAWNWRPGSWCYLVYDEADRTVRPLTYDTPGARTLRAKITYFFTVG